MPFGALLDQKVLCIHGGLGPHVNSIHDIRMIRKPVLDFPDNVSQELVWSDPDNRIPFIFPSPRGTGYLFGEKTLENFLDSNALKYLVRGHQCIQEGVELSLNDKCITVFSASCYAGTNKNMSGVLNYKSPEKYLAFKLTPLRYLERNDTNIIDKMRIKPRASLLQSASQKLLIDNTQHQQPHILKPKVFRKSCSTVAFHNLYL